MNVSVGNARRGLGAAYDGLGLLAAAVAVLALPVAVGIALDVQSVSDILAADR